MREVNPNDNVVFISGLPATGKSTFARFLHRNHGFTHYNLECFPSGWPHDLRDLWNSSRNRFLRKVRNLHGTVAIEWGFPPIRIDWALELRDAGARPIWFTGDQGRLREFFEARGGIDVQDFDVQVAAIRASDPNAKLGGQVVEVLRGDGSFRNLDEIWADVFN